MTAYYSVNLPNNKAYPFMKRLPNQKSWSVPNYSPIILPIILALLFDLSDRKVFALTGGLISGHTIKHVIAALAAYWVVRYLQRRRVL